MTPTRPEKFKNNTNTGPGVDRIYMPIYRDGYISEVIAFKIEKRSYFQSKTRVHGLEFNLI